MTETTRPPTQSAGAETKVTGAAREAFFDNAKYLALVLVAVAHSWEPLRSRSQAVSALYIVVYTFHMPAFIVISGYFSRTFRFEPRQVRRLVTGVAVPYVVFETGYTFFLRWTTGSPSAPISLLDPWFLTWFLAALFVWRLTAPLWAALRHPLPVALVVAALAAMSPRIGNDLDLQRVLQFLPYFVLGTLLRPAHFRFVRHRAVRLLAVPVFAGTFAFAWWAVTRMDMGWFTRRYAAQEMGEPWWTGPVMTCGLFACALVLTVCFAALVPERQTWFTPLGAGTLGGYLLHGFLVQGSRKLHWYGPHWVHTGWGAVVVSAAAAAAVTLLCVPPVQRVFRFALAPRMAWAFRPEGGTPAGGTPVTPPDQAGDVRPDRPGPQRSNSCGGSPSA